MTRSSRACVFVVVGTAFVAVAGDKPDIVADELATLKTVAKCSDPASLWRSWCIATDWSTGTAADLPKSKTLVGLTIQLEKGKEADDLTNGVTLAAMAIDADGKVKLTDVKPTNKDEEKSTAEAVFNVAVLMKGKAKIAKLPADLASYAKSLKGAYATKKIRGDWTWTGASPAKMRKVGAYWVVVETPSKGNGIFATILTDAWE